MNRWLPFAFPALIGAAPGQLAPGDPGGPVILTPDTVTWQSSLTATGSNTTYFLSGDAILQWTTFQLPEGDELVFDFANSNDSIANLLGNGNHIIDGTVTSNGTVGFFADGNIEVGGSVTARDVTISALPVVDPNAFLAGGDLDLSGSLFRQLTVDGEARATNGDVRLAGDLVRVRGDADLRARGAVRIGAGTSVTMTASGKRRVTSSGGVGVTLHLGDSRASRIEMVASSELTNGGRIEANGGYGKIFLEVGPGGTVLNEGTGVLVGQVAVVGEFNDGGVILGPDEGDTLQVVNASVVKLPTVKRPDGSVASKARVLETNVAMSGSADALRDESGGERPRTVVRGTEKPVMSRQSFFGMRGGAEAKKR